MSLLTDIVIMGTLKTMKVPFIWLLMVCEVNRVIRFKL